MTPMHAEIMSRENEPGRFPLGRHLLATLQIPFLASFSLFYPYISQSRTALAIRSAPVEGQAIHMDRGGGRKGCRQGGERAQGGI